MYGILLKVNKLLKLNLLSVGPSLQFSFIKSNHVLYLNSDYHCVQTFIFSNHFLLVSAAVNLEPIRETLGARWWYKSRNHIFKCLIIVLLVWRTKNKWLIIVLRLFKFIKFDQLGSLWDPIPGISYAGISCMGIQIPQSWPSQTCSAKALVQDISCITLYSLLLVIAKMGKANTINHADQNTLQGIFMQLLQGEDFHPPKASSCHPWLTLCKSPSDWGRSEPQTPEAPDPPQFGGNLIWSIPTLCSPSGST